MNLHRTHAIFVDNVLLLSLVASLNRREFVAAAVSDHQHAVALNRREFVAAVSDHQHTVALL